MTAGTAGRIVLLGCAFFAAVMGVLFWGRMQREISGRSDEDMQQISAENAAGDMREAEDKPETQRAEIEEAAGTAPPAEPEYDKALFAAEESFEENGFVRLICVPADYLWLRSRAGLGEGDRIAELKAGVVLKWYGEKETVNGSVYYYVTVDDTGEEGYVPERYCMETVCYADETVLDIVQTENALYSYEEMKEDIEALCARYSDCLRSEVIGESVDGRAIYALTLGNPEAENHMMLQAAIHGREYMNAQLVMRLAEYYCCYYEAGSYSHIPYSRLFDKTALHLIPMANPDGVTIAQGGIDQLRDPSIEKTLRDCYLNDRAYLAWEEDGGGDFMWTDHYKNAAFDLSAAKDPRMISFEEYLTIWKANARGVDLNNNFDAGWEETKLKATPSYGSYKGPQPVSEPEAAALAAYAKRYDYRCFVNYHSRGQLIYYDVRGNSEQNAKASQRLAGLMEKQIKYAAVNSKDSASVNMGGFGAWAQLGLDKPSITIESGKHPCPLKAEEFPAIWNRHRESWAMLCAQLY